MNTIRFMLLLLSVFFFAFLFQTTPSRKTTKEEVLSGNTSLSPAALQLRTQVLPIQETILQYQYPGARMLSQNETDAWFSSTDGIDKIVKWYSVKLHSPLPDELFNKNTTQNYFLSGVSVNTKITANILKSKNSDHVFIIISVTAS